MLHSTKQPLNDMIIDDLLGIKKAEETERKINPEVLDSKYSDEQYIYVGTPYEKIRKFLKKLNLGKEDEIWDLGCGYGRVSIYASLTTPSRCKGIELVSERVKKMEKIKDRLNLTELEIIEGNVLEQDYSKGSVFFLFNPFEQKTLKKVGNNLREISLNKKIKIVSLGKSNDFFQKQDWLRLQEKEIERTRPNLSLAIFESK